VDPNYAFPQYAFNLVWGSFPDPIPRAGNEAVIIHMYMYMYVDLSQHVHVYVHGIARMGFYRWSLARDGDLPDSLPLARLHQRRGEVGGSGRGTLDRSKLLQSGERGRESHQEDGL
jgi:hypothetical protein